MKRYPSASIQALGSDYAQAYTQRRTKQREANIVCAYLYASCTHTHTSLYSFGTRLPRPIASASKLHRQSAAPFPTFNHRISGIGDLNRR